jgi:DNA-binding transcriptional regulator GbsR (MarR family)
MFQLYLKHPKGAAMSEREEEALAARLRVADVVGNLMEFWGFKRAMGRVWGLLYLSPKPLPAAVIGDELQMSAGAVSMTLAELGKWAVVRRSWVPGDRRDFYEAETSIWKLVSRVVRERELALIREARDSFAAADRALSASAQGASPDEKKRRAFERERIAQLRSLSETGDKLLSALVAGEEISAEPLFGFGPAAASNDERRRRK